MSVDLVSPLLSRVKVAVGARLAAAGSPVVSSAVVAGEVAYDDCCTTLDGANGQVRVRAVAVYPVEQFPIAAAVTRTACWPQQAVDIEVTVVRCAQTMDDDGTPPTDAALESEAALVGSDRVAVRDALVCDLLDAPGLDEDRLLGNLRWEPVGPQGGCVGGRTTFTLGLTECTCDDA